MPRAAAFIVSGGVAAGGAARAGSEDVVEKSTPYALVVLVENGISVSSKTARRV